MAKHYRPMTWARSGEHRRTRSRDSGAAGWASRGVASSRSGVGWTKGAFKKTSRPTTCGRWVEKLIGAWAGGTAYIDLSLLSSTPQYAGQHPYGTPSTPRRGGRHSYPARSAGNPPRRSSLKPQACRRTVTASTSRKTPGTP